MPKKNPTSVNHHQRKPPKREKTTFPNPKKNAKKPSEMKKTHHKSNSLSRRNPQHPRRQPLIKRHPPFVLDNTLCNTDKPRPPLFLTRVFLNPRLDGINGGVEQGPTSARDETHDHVLVCGERVCAFGLEVVHFLFEVLVDCEVCGLVCCCLFFVFLCFFCIERRGRI